MYANILHVMNLSLICLILSVKYIQSPQKSKYTAMFASINNEIQCAPLLYLSSRFTTYTPSSILGKLSLEKTPLNLGSLLKINMDHCVIDICTISFFLFSSDFYLRNCFWIRQSTEISL